MLDFLLGSVKENAEREYANYDFETGKRKRDLGDILGDALTGRGAAIDEAVRQEHIRRLKKDYGVAADEVNTYLGGSSKVPTIDANTDPDVLRQEIQRAAPKVQEIKDTKSFAAANGILLNPSEFGGDASAMMASANTKINAKKESERLKLKAEQDEETRRLEGRSDDRLSLQLELNRLDRKDEREARRDQTALANRRLDIQEARGMRRDRQAAIQQMMAGLAQMGASIAI